MSTITAITCARLFDGTRWHDNTALVIDGGRIDGLAAPGTLPEGCRIERAEGQWLVPGFVDLQVNGGGGLLLNDAPTAETIATICAAHRPFGTTALMPTLITDTAETTQAAIKAAEEAARANVPGFLGLHLEGPHLAPARKGAHDAALIRPMDDTDLDRLTTAARALPVLIVTLAPENASPAQVTALAEAGAVVSLGHSNTDCATARAYAAAGARLVTHLFNAMSPLAHREPGLVGAALDTGTLSAGMIADGFHVDPAVMAIALRAKAGPGRIFLVTDAMAPLGTDMTQFTLNGRTIYRSGGRLTLEDGTLAGADIDMISSIRLLHREVGIPLDEVLRMASLYPAEAVGVGARKGRLAAGHDADVVALSPELAVRTVWTGGERLDVASAGT